MDFNPQTTAPKDYIETLLGYCAPNIFDTEIESPFNTLTQAEDWSIATQFLLGFTNIYAASQGIIGKDTNFGQILDSNPDLSNSLAQTLVRAQNAHDDIEEIALAWMNTHATELKLNTSFTQEDFKAIKKTFVTLYSQIKDSPHFDEFFVLDTQKKGDFVIHQGNICMSFAKFASSPFFALPQELTQPLQRMCTHASTLNTEIHHKNQLIQEEVEIKTTIMDPTALLALYEGVNSHKDPEVRKTLLRQLALERPDFKLQIDIKAFLQHVAYGQQDEAEALLRKELGLAQEFLLAQNRSFTDYSGRTFTCSAYEYAWWAKDTHMCRMLEKYMGENTRSEILKRVQVIEGHQGPGLFKKPKGLTYTQQGKVYRSAHFDLTPLKNALRTYIEKYDQSLKATYTDWKDLHALWIKIGFPQRELPAHIVQEYCHPKRSFEEVAKKPALLDAANPDNLERQLKFYDLLTGACEAWFTPTPFEENSALGVSFALFRGWYKYGAWARMGVAICNTYVRSIAAIDLSAIEAIDKVRTKDLERSLENLAAPSHLQATTIRSSKPTVSQ
nr:hypothetical protein [Legionella norrlandica]